MNAFMWASLGLIAALAPLGAFALVAPELDARAGCVRPLAPAAAPAAAGAARPAPRAPVRVLKAAHSGIVGDYVLWLAAGTVLLAGLWAFTIR